MKKTVLTLAVLAFACMAATAVAGIKDTKHDLSSTNTNIEASPTKQVCIFCHTPHNPKVDVPLWNRNNPEATAFDLYSSGSMKNRPGGTFQADSVSLMCMSCHDGNGLAGRVVNHNTTTEDWGTGVTSAAYHIENDAIIETAKSNLDDSTNSLRNDHPVGFKVETYTGLVDGIPGKTIGTLPLYKGGYLECASCHAVHDNSKPPFLRITSEGSALCLACHAK